MHGVMQYMSFEISCMWGVFSHAIIAKMTDSVPRRHNLVTNQSHTCNIDFGIKNLTT